MSAKQSFTTAEFDRLRFVAGSAGSSQDLVAVARSGENSPAGTLANEVDSPAVQITASVTGTRSINAVAALQTQATGPDAGFIDIARRASIFTGCGSSRPSLATVENLSQPGITGFEDALGAYQSSEISTAAAINILDGYAGGIGSRQVSASTTAFRNNA